MPNHPAESNPNSLVMFVSSLKCTAVPWKSDESLSVSAVFIHVEEASALLELSQRSATHEESYLHYEQTPSVMLSMCVVNTR